MTLSQKLREYVTAAFSGIWVQSVEHDDALREFAQLCRQQKWSLSTWDVDRGLLVLPNFHRFLQSTEVIRALAHRIQAANRTAPSS